MTTNILDDKKSPNCSLCMDTRIITSWDQQHVGACSECAPGKTVEDIELEDGVKIARDLNGFFKRWSIH